MDFSKEKQKIRENIKSLRSRQSLFEKNNKNREIRKKLFSLEEFKEAKTISIYVSRKEEADTKNIIRKALEMGKKIAVPSLKNNKLCMCLINETDNLDEHIPFLKSNQEAGKVKPEKLNLIIVPGIAFDERGRRIGSGKGYYDMFLETIKGKIPLIALAYDFQILKEIPIEPHDVHMDKIITEKRVITANF